MDDLTTEERILVAAATRQHRRPDEDLDSLQDTALWLESGRPPSVSVTRVKRHLGAWQNQDLATWPMTQLIQVASRAKQDLNVLWLHVQRHKGMTEERLKTLLSGTAPST